MNTPADSLHELQQAFLAYLLDDSAGAIAGRIVSTPQRPAEQRLRFYGNAYRVRLKEALETDYERLHTYLGDELFDALVQQYIDRYPSHYRSLRDYGSRLAQLTGNLEPFCRWPEVAELARIEQAFGHSFDAADAPAATLQALQALAPEAWATLHLGFHPSVQLLPQRYNSFQIWQALTDGTPPPDRTRDDSTWLIWRHNLVSSYRSLPHAELAALQVMLAGGSFAEMCELMLQYRNKDEAALYALTCLQQWIHDGMICEYLGSE